MSYFPRRLRRKVKNFECRYKCAQVEYPEKNILVNVNFEASDFVARKRLERIASWTDGFFEPRKRPFDYPCYYSSNRIMEICLEKKRGENKWTLYLFPHGCFMAHLPSHKYMAEGIIDSIMNLKNESDRLNN